MPPNRNLLFSEIETPSLHSPPPTITIDNFSANPAATSTDFKFTIPLSLPPQPSSPPILSTETPSSFPPTSTRTRSSIDISTVSFEFAPTPSPTRGVTSSTPSLSTLFSSPQSRSTMSTSPVPTSPSISPQATQTPQDITSREGISTGTIIGITVGAVLAAIMTAVLGVYLMFRKNAARIRRCQEKAKAPAPAPEIAITPASPLA